MTQSAGVWFVLIVALVAANLPFINERLFVVGPRRAGKTLAWRLLELAVLGAATIGIGLAVEARIGQRHAQGWEFHAALAFMFMTFAFPGFVWRHLRRRR